MTAEKQSEIFGVFLKLFRGEGVENIVALSGELLPHKVPRIFLIENLLGQSVLDAPNVTPKSTITKCLQRRKLQPLRLPQKRMYQWQMHRPLLQICLSQSTT
jgi:hypothetical protein